jgi:hypothetical protein
MEVCSLCAGYPCHRFEPERKGFDSFVTHKKVFENLDSIKKQGIEPFIRIENERMIILNDFLLNFDEGRSKSFFCISCTLLPLENLKKMQRLAADFNRLPDIRVRNKKLKESLLKEADNLGIVLKLTSSK